MITVKSVSRNVLQLLECYIIIQTVPCNSIINDNYDQKIILELSFSRKKVLNLFLKDILLVIFCIFLFCCKLSIELQITIISHCFWYRVFDEDLCYNVLIFQYLTMYSYFNTSSFVKLVWLINFYFLGALLHYQLFLLPLDDYGI